MTTTPAGPIVLAFGGNALLPDPFHPEEQEERARDLARAVLLLRGRGQGLVLVHGNGPQVGMILLRVEATQERLPGEPLDQLVAETQGSVGVLLARALLNALHARGARVPVTSLLTQVVVDPGDPAFGRPTKPIGPEYEAGAAERLRREHGWHLVETKPGHARRVVASPRPLEVVELASVAEMARGGHVVVAGGGGGVPVRRDAAGLLHGVEAVVDKDRTAALMAAGLDAAALVVLTGVPSVARGYGTPAEEPIDRMTVTEARDLLTRGEFPAGSMGPKIEALCNFVETTARPALVTDTTHLPEALEGRAGTRIFPDDA